jgi:hypothetical protein
MKVSIRQSYFRVFAIFFIIITPLLILFTLGYDFDIQTREVKGTHLVNIETLPRNAQVIVNSSNQSNTPLELSLTNKRKYDIVLQKPDYYNEEFSILSSNGENTTSSLTTLSMFPKTPTQLNTPQQDTTFLSILNENLILSSSANSYILTPISFGGIQGQSLAVANPSNLILTSPSTFQFIEPGYWFEKDNALLTVVNSKWTFIDLKTRFLGIKSIIGIGKDSFVLLDESKNIWKYSTLTGDFQFLDSGISGISYTKSNSLLWLLKGKQLIRTTISQENSFDLRYENYIELDNFIDIQNPTTEFQLKNVYQGILIRRQGEVVYVPDFDRSDVLPVAGQVKKLSVSGSVMFWVDIKNQLYSYNFVFQKEKAHFLVENFEYENFDMFYYPDWKRVMVYSGNNLYTIWYDRDIANQSIVSYNPIQVTGVSCQKIVAEKNQICIQDNNLVTFANNRFW